MYWFSIAKFKDDKILSIYSIADVPGMLVAVGTIDKATMPVRSVLITKAWFRGSGFILPERFYPNRRTRDLYVWRSNNRAGEYHFTRRCAVTFFYVRSECEFLVSWPCLNPEAPRMPLALQ